MNIHDDTRIETINYKFDTSALHDSCRHGQLHIVDWIYSLDYNIDMDALFHIACINGRIDIVKWVHARYHSTISEETFIKICIHNVSEIERGIIFNYRYPNPNHLAVAQWLCSEHPYVKRFITEKLLTMTCRYDHLDMVQWLYAMVSASASASSKETIDTNRLFIQCCRNNSILPILQWTYSISDKTAVLGGFEEYIITNPPTTKSMECAKWLFSLHRACFFIAKKLIANYCRDGMIREAKWVCNISYKLKPHLQFHLDQYWARNK
jgi:hypothetical protein